MEMNVCSSPLEAPRNKRHLYSASSCNIWRSEGLIKSGYLKIKIGYLTPAFLGVPSKGDKIFRRPKEAELLGNPCFLGDPQKCGIDMAHVGPAQKGL